MPKTISFAESAAAPEDNSFELTYDAEPTARKFMLSNEPVRCVLGPVGSGKSTMCVIELLRRAMAQTPYRGVRSTRFAIIRQHYPELMTTTLRTVTDWLPEKTIPGYSFVINRSKPMVAYLTLDMGDKTVVKSEWLFLALDDDSDAVKLRSLEITMGWMNEASEMTELNFTTLGGRVGRHPKANKGGCTFHGVILDSNPPSVDHFIYDFFELKKLPGHVLWHQPPGVLEVPRKNPNDPVQYVTNIGQDPDIPAAENIQYLPGKSDYYLKQTYGSSSSYIRVYLMGEYGQIMAGKPVYPEFRDLHVAKQEILPARGLPLILSFDYGVTPSCVMAQLTARGQLVFIDEMVCGLREKELEKRDKTRYFSDMGIRNFAINHLKPYLLNQYGGMTILCTGDPAGGQRNQTNEMTCMDELSQCGFDVTPAVSNNFIKRREAVEAFMMRIDGLLVSPRCHYLTVGFQGKYRYRQVAKPNNETAYTYEPEKNIYSHPHDAAQYAAMFTEVVSYRTGKPIPSQIGGSSRFARREIADSGLNHYV